MYTWIELKQVNFSIGHLSTTNEILPMTLGVTPKVYAPGNTQDFKHLSVR